MGRLLYLILFSLSPSIYCSLSAQAAKSLYEKEYCTVICDFKFLKEGHKSLSIKEIVAQEYRLESDNPHELRVSPDYAVWLKVKIPQSIDTSEQYFLAIGEFDEITFYSPSEMGGWKALKNGKLIPPPQRAVDETPIVFPVKGQLAGQSCWLKVVHYNPLDRQLIQPCLMGNNSFQQYAEKTSAAKGFNNIIVGVMGGLFLAFLFYPILFYFFVRRTYFVYYALYVIINTVLLVYTFEKCGYLDIAFSYYPKVLIHLEPSLYALLAVFYFLFLRNFVLTIKKSKAVDIALIALIVFEMIIWLVDVVCKLFLNEMNLPYKVMGWFVSPILLLLFYVIYQLFFLKSKVLTFLAIGMSMVIIGLIFSSMVFSHSTAFPLGSVFSNFHTFYLVGVLVELLFFSLALSQANQDFRNVQLIKELSLKSQITDLEKKALQAQMNPHFIFNCLTSIQKLILEKDANNAMRYLIRFSKLVRGTLNASVAGEVTLEEETGLLQNYLELEKLRFKDAFHYSITVHPSLDQHGISFSPMLLQPYVENAIVHGMQQKENGGQVGISFQPIGPNVVAVITDNGPGIFHSPNKKANHKSVGMSITRRRLELLHQIEGEEGLVRVEEMMDKNGQVIGTRVQVRLK